MCDAERDEKTYETSAPRVRQLKMDSVDASISSRWLEECKTICQTNNAQTVTDANAAFHIRRERSE